MGSIVDFTAEKVIRRLRIRRSGSGKPSTEAIVIGLVLAFLLLFWFWKSGRCEAQPDDAPAGAAVSPEGCADAGDAVQPVPLVIPAGAP